MYVLSLSYGKDSLRLLYLIKELGLPLDRIVHARVMFDDNIPADLPDVVSFQNYVDRRIFVDFGISVEHYSVSSFVELFSKYDFPHKKMNWCNSKLKLSAIKKCGVTSKDVEYIGICFDEPERYFRLKGNKVAPLYEYHICEQDCFDWCKENNLLSPSYNRSFRDGCFFCHFQSINALRYLYNNHFNLYSLLLCLEEQSKRNFVLCDSGISLSKYAKRFDYENKGYVSPFRPFRWRDLEDKYIQLSLI